MAEKNNANKNLLIISCSKRKRKVNGKIRAWDLYDGVVFRMIRKIEKDKKLENIKILILSAHYGLVAKDSYISYYDKIMTEEVALKLRRQVERQLENILEKTKFIEIFCCLGKNYLKCIEAFLQDLEIPVRLAHGPIGQKLSLTKKWIMCRSLSKEG